MYDSYTLFQKEGSLDDMLTNTPSLIRIRIKILQDFEKLKKAAGGCHSTKPANKKSGGPAAPPSLPIERTA